MYLSCNFVAFSGPKSSLLESSDHHIMEDIVTNSAAVVKSNVKRSNSSTNSPSKTKSDAKSKSAKANSKTSKSSEERGVAKRSRPSTKSSDGKRQPERSVNRDEDGSRTSRKRKLVVVSDNDDDDDLDFVDLDEAVDRKETSSVDECSDESAANGCVIVSDSDDKGSDANESCASHQQRLTSAIVTEGINKLT